MARDTEPAVRGRARRYAAEEPEPERDRNPGRSEERPGYGRGQWGSEEQGGWRGPGAGPGYREARQQTQTFQQSSAGGQIPGEYRYWRSGQRPELSGPHAGRGPKNYRRSDDRIREELCDRLMAHPEIDASEIEVEVKEAHVVLRGTVPDRRTKHRAEDIADHVLGALDIDNQLRVRRGEAPPREQH
ncbi:MAG TPA: BON domain-containing protein [Thermoanaerobaculia bacterium]|nr:BON domain-containing protein [Thermoanaerobaculia bacterium]